MASKMEPGETTPGQQHVCAQCAKVFRRLCDFNKHTKTHSRPFKCAIQTCKYHEYGWPTAKELERHINDKHTEAPTTFDCLYKPCTYKSKRESNCKQHMEKTHKWKYVRTKTTAKIILDDNRDMLDHRLHVPGVKSFKSAMASPSLSLSSPQQDFVLYPCDNDASSVLEDEDDGVAAFDHTRGQDSQVYLPWTSPTTRIRRNENFLETFTQTYNGAPDRPATSTDSLIDPTLPQYTPADFPGPGMSEAANLHTSQRSIKMEVASTTSEQPHMNQSESRRGSSASLYKRALHGQTAAYPPSDRAPPGVSLPATTNSRLSYSANKPALSRRRFGEDEDSDDDIQSPQKRQRSNPVENFSDTDMPDIFRFAHPHIYDRDRKEKFSPCHSSHRDISTLVRHLSRPAHRLHVTDRFISSFEVNDPEYPHPRLGLCRRCWLAFPDRIDFESHLARTCDKVSKGKREKWRILLDNFTPLIHQPGDHEQTAHALSSDQIHDSASSRRPSNVHNHTAQLATPTSASFSSTPGINMVSQVPTQGFVPMSEHLKLQREHHALCQEHRSLCQKHHQLVEATKALFQSQSQQDSLAALAQRSGGNLWAALPSDQHQSQRIRTGAAQSTNSKDSVSDQESLVLHMDSQPTDVDIQGLMNEAPDGPSRQNSGLSSMSRSTIHHVPNSPPPLPADQEGVDCDDGFGEPRKPSPSRRPPPSIPDSAYGTDPRRGSLAEQGCGEAATDAALSKNHNQDRRLSSQQQPPLNHDLGKVMNMGELAVNRRKPNTTTTTLVDDEMLPITWSNPWGGASQQGPTSAMTNQPAMADSHTFINGETAPTQTQPGQSCEPNPSFDDFYSMNMELEPFDWGV